MCTTYVCFLAALLAFESGWDRDRYNAGTIQDWQLTQWAGGPVEAFYPDHASWSELTDDEWKAMSYRSTNSLGFVGYQFGEALLIDLGYYQDDVYYGAGSATNTWDGTWTGKHGVNSLDHFKTTEAQTFAIQEAFGYNLQILQNQLSAYGKSLDSYIGTTRNYTQNGETVSVELTLSGILAASHLRGAWGTASLLLADTVSTDENGTSILQYIKQFGGYEAPGINALIAFHDGKVIGDEGLGSLLLPGETAGSGGGGNDPETSASADSGSGNGGGDTDPDEDPETGPQTPADIIFGEGSDTVQLAYAWGSFQTVDGFDPAEDRIDFGSLPGADLLIEDTDEGLKVTVKNNGGAGYLLKDVHAADLSIADNIAAALWNPVITEGGGVADQLRGLGSRD